MPSTTSSNTSLSMGKNDLSPVELGENRGLFSFSQAGESLFSLLAGEYPELVKGKEFADKQQQHILDRFGDSAHPFVEELRDVKNLISSSTGKRPQKGTDWADILSKAVSVVGLLARYADTGDSLTELFHEVVLAIVDSPHHARGKAQAWYVRAYHALTRRRSSEGLVRIPNAVLSALDEFQREAEAYWLLEGRLPNEREAAKNGWLPEYIAEALMRLLPPISIQDWLPTSPRSAVEGFLLAEYLRPVRRGPAGECKSQGCCHAGDHPCVGGPEEEHIKRDEEAEAAVIFDRLTGFECGVILLRCQGYGYEQIAETLRANIKSVDNAVQRAKRKMKILADERNAFKQGGVPHGRQRRERQTLTLEAGGADHCEGG